MNSVRVSSSLRTAARSAGDTLDASGDRGAFQRRRSAVDAGCRSRARSRHPPWHSPHRRDRLGSLWRYRCPTEDPSSWHRYPRLWLVFPAADERPRGSKRSVRHFTIRHCWSGRDPDETANLVVTLLRVAEPGSQPQYGPGARRPVVGHIGLPRETRPLPVVSLAFHCGSSSGCTTLKVGPCSQARMRVQSRNSA